MLEYHTIPAVPFGKFELAGASDPFLLDLSTDIFVLELTLEVAGVFDRFPSRQAIEQEAIVQVEATNVLVWNHNAVNVLATLLRFLHVLDRLHARSFRSRTYAKFISDLQAFDLG